MSTTQMTTSDALRKQQWESALFRDTVLNTFWAKFMGQTTQKLEQGFKVAPGEDYALSGANDVMQVKMNLAKKAGSTFGSGDKITFGLVPRLDPKATPGVTTGQTLEGKEQELSWYDFSVTLERYRHAVSAAEPMSWHRASFNIADEARTALMNWGVEKIDILAQTALDTSPTKIFYKTSAGVLSTGTASTAKSALTAADSKLTPQAVSFIKTWALTGGGRSQIPIRPIMVKGKKVFVILTHPDNLYDWKQDPTWQQAAREAEMRGKENPLFSGAAIIWDDVVIHESENVAIATDAGSGSDVPWSKSYLLGAQALCWAWGEMPSIIEYKRDAEENLYYAWRMTGGVAKPKFNSVDYGSVCLYLSRTNVSGA